MMQLETREVGGKPLTVLVVDAQSLMEALACETAVLASEDAATLTMALGAHHTRNVSAEVVSAWVDVCQAAIDEDREVAECRRCGSPLTEEPGTGATFCTDKTCPFSDHAQDCPAGWAGHPRYPQAGACTCGARPQREDTEDRPL